MIYQKMEIDGPRKPSLCNSSTVGMISFTSAFLATLMLASYARPSDLWIAATSPIVGTRVNPSVLPAQPIGPMARRADVVQAIALLPEPEDDPGFDIEWDEDDVEADLTTAEKKLDFAVFMAARIRLTRKGRHKRPFYRLVVQDSRMPRDGRFLEVVGTYDPLKENDDPERVSLKVERILYWLQVGAHPSDTAANLFARAGLKLPPWLVKKMDKTKAGRVIADKNRKKAAIKAKADEAAKVAAAAAPK
jgi:small subunit ribosomal protein S16